jgi:predicted nucleic acid-binding protein
MRILCDTSVLVAALVQAHPMHSLALPWLERAKQGKVELLVATHSLAELFAVLSGLPVRPRISPRLARQLIEESIEPVAELVPLSVADYRAVLDRMAELGLAGGSIYDGLAARAAEKSKAAQLLTFNERDFRRLWPEVTGKVLRPGHPPG